MPDMPIFIGSMYNIFTYTYHKFKPAVGKLISYHTWIPWDSKIHEAKLLFLGSRFHQLELLWLNCFSNHFFGGR